MSEERTSGTIRSLAVAALTAIAAAGVLPVLETLPRWSGLLVGLIAAVGVAGLVVAGGKATELRERERDERVNAMEKRLESERVSGLAREILRLLLDSPESHNEVSWSASFGGDQFQFAKMTFKAKSRTPGSLREMRSLEAAVESLVTEGALRLVKDSDGWRSWKLAPLADAVAEQFPVTTRIDWGSWDSLD